MEKLKYKYRVRQLLDTNLNKEEIAEILQLTMDQKVIAMNNESVIRKREGELQAYHVCDRYVKPHRISDEEFAMLPPDLQETIRSIYLG